jgi:tetratricopeptide (TPR) repeat protein
MKAAEPKVNPPSALLFHTAANISEIPTFTFMKKILLLFSSLLILAACSEETVNSETIKKEIKEAPEDYIEQLSDKIVESPNNGNLYVKRALAYADRNLMELALKDVDRALSIDSTASYFHQVKGEVYFMRAELRPARLSLEKSVELDETNIDGWLKLAEVLLLLRRYDETLVAVNNALRLDDQLHQAYYLKGYVYKETMDTTLALSSFQTAVEVAPNFYEAYIELGNLNAYQGNPIALEYFNTALEIRPKSAEAFYSKGMFYQAGRKFEEAEATYKEMLQADPNNVLAYYNLGYIYLTEYLSFDTAAAYFDSAVVVRPDYIQAIYNRGLAYEEMGEYGRAESSYRQALNIDPQYDKAALGLSRLLE